jgi:hypothetical protein
MNDIHDIKPVISLEYISRGAVLVIVLVFCAILIGLIVWLIYRYAKKQLAKEKVLEAVSEQKIDYQEIARQKLEKAKEKIKQGQFKEFHLEVASIIREYLNGQFGIEAIDMTSREILSLPQLSSEIKKELRGFFELNDHSKFAGVREEEGVARKVLDAGSIIIELKVKNEA